MSAAKMVIYSCQNRCNICNRSVTVQCIFDLSLSTADKTYNGNGNINVINITQNGLSFRISDVENFYLPLIEDGQIFQISASITDIHEQSSRTHFNLVSHEKKNSQNIFRKEFIRDIILPECGSVQSYNLTLYGLSSSITEIRRFSITPEGKHFCWRRQLLNKICARHILQISENVLHI